MYDDEAASLDTEQIYLLKSWKNIIQTVLGSFYHIDVLQMNF